MIWFLIYFVDLKNIFVRLRQDY